MLVKRSIDKNRNRTADLLKGIAVILMIQVHLLELFASPEIYASWIGKISLFLGGPPAAPVFMVVMGYYLAGSKRALRSSTLRGVKLIFLGFALNILMNVNLFLKIADGTYQTSPWPYVFGVDILFLAGLSIIILAILKHLFQYNLIAYLALLVIIFTLQAIDFEPAQKQILIYLYAYVNGKGTWWSYFPLIPWLAYPLSGFIFKILQEKYEKNREKLQRYLLLPTGILTFVFINYGIDVSSELPEYYHHNFVFFLFTCCFLVFYTIIMDIISNQEETNPGKWVAWLGINVTSAYVIQWLFIGNIATEVYKTQEIFPLIFWFLASLFITTIGVFFWNKIKSTLNHYIF